MRLPDFSFENKFWRDGYHFVIGVDEVGRGAFAGPVMAGACGLRIMNNELRMKEKQDFLNSVQKLGIDDSKRLSPLQRERLDKEIRKYFHYAVGQASVAEINKVGIVKATEKAMRRAVKRIMNYKLGIMMKNDGHNSSFLIRNSKVYMLVDGFNVKYIPGIGLKNQKAIVKGDQKSISIAAASIIAKVARDKLMCKLSTDYKKFMWDKNKGYGTWEHRAALSEYGTTRFHRRQFISDYI